MDYYIGLFILLVRVLQVMVTVGLVLTTYYLFVWMDEVNKSIPKKTKRGILK